jgi:hypothetical protein
MAGLMQGLSPDFLGALQSKSQLHAPRGGLRIIDALSIERLRRLVGVKNWGTLGSPLLVFEIPEAQHEEDRQTEPHKKRWKRWRQVCLNFWTTGSFICSQIRIYQYTGSPCSSLVVSSSTRIECFHASNKDAIPMSVLDLIQIHKKTSVARQRYSIV